MIGRVVGLLVLVSLELLGTLSLHNQRLAVGAQTTVNHRRQEELQRRLQELDLLEATWSSPAAVRERQDIRELWETVSSAPTL
ncbi:MAG: hypothetical protein MK213_07575 [Planctomycetes bacterium]|nr:hypothetical protein [Planctomycetota bacterium]